ncbi:Reticulocyte-binding protein 2 homolog a [Durusdinium trenchii]|uniref:Reticulocyte-binding protein 2 homolog a n=1 Tax=Durusdinium trenchii TaxID=1381693 RepID=A0ABP0JPB9_9DINO
MVCGKGFPANEPELSTERIWIWLASPRFTLSSSQGLDLVAFTLCTDFRFALFKQDQFHLHSTILFPRTNEVSADDPPSELVRFRVDGEHFEILEQTLRAKGDTLLVTLLDDHWRTKTKEICVEGNKERFRYILDWYRYGSILLPWNISVAEMKRDCAFFQLPDDVQIRRESATISDGIGMLADVQKEVEEIRQAAEADIRQAEAKIIAMWIVQTILSQLASTLSTQKSEVEVDLEIGKDIRCASKPWRMSRCATLQQELRTGDTRDSTPCMEAAAQQAHSVGFGVLAVLDEERWANSTNIDNPQFSWLKGFGNCFTWGANSQGQLGDDDVEGRSAPNLVEDLLGAMRCAASSGSAALTKEGDVIVWGFATRAARPRRVALEGAVVAQIALSGAPWAEAVVKDLLLCVTISHELIFLPLFVAASRGQRGTPWIAHGDVLQVAASDSLVVALASPPPAEEPRLGGAIVTQPAVPARRPHVRVPELVSDAQLTAAKERLERQVEELRAEHFLELCGLRRAKNAADARALQMAAVHQQQLQSSRQEQEEEVQELRKELHLVREALSEEEAQKTARPSTRLTKRANAALRHLQSTRDEILEEQQELEMKDEELKSHVEHLESELGCSRERLERLSPAVSLAQQVLLEAQNEEQLHMEEARQVRRRGLEAECHASERQLEQQHLEVAQLSKRQELARLREQREELLRTVHAQRQRWELSLRDAWAQLDR